ncbi:hypothetical protein DQM14_02015 [Limosilactobacillus fermentum]|uniref:hypothetical protein n=1 Tax=Limosilactobacillus fermentum TaxID=1613 RepID=UPI000E091B65|nr:hypothetical protein [Limosilactobacillus fermentum]RDG20883.1 hypothetical protein DQM14_02015 [Limosilactobacillus fermentum]
MVQTLNFINLSSQQAPNDVDWAGLVNSGVQGVLIRLGHGIIRDPCASGHIAKAKQYGLYWHGYHTYEGVVNEPQFTIKNATELGLSTSQYYFVDLTKSSDPFNDYYALHATWLSQGYSTGLLISNEDYLSKFKDSEVTASGTLRWLISDTEPADYDVWQYSSEGTVGTSSVKVGFNFAKTDKLKYNLNTTLTGTDISKDPYNPQTPVGGAYIGWGYDTTGLGGGKTIGYSTNGKNFYALIGPDGLVVRKSDGNRIYGTIADQIDSAISANVIPAKSAADSAVAYANDAIEKSRVNSQAIAAQSEAISEAKSAMDSATAEIQQAIANAISDAANIRAGVAQVQNEVDTAKAANSASVEALKSDVSATKQDLADVHDSLTKAQATAEDSQKAINKSIAQINDSVAATNKDLEGVRNDLTKAQSDITANQKSINDNVAQINSDIEQDRKDIASAQQANADTAKQLDAYSKQAQDQGKTIKSIQDKQDGFTATLADVQGNVTQVSDKVDGLSANLKDAQNNVASVKAQADQLSATLTDHAKSIATLTASAKEVSSTLEDADGRLSKVEQTAQTNSSTLSDVQGDLSQIKQDATTLTSTLKDAQGNISTLQQKADSVSDQLASAQGDIASLQTDVKGIKATLVSHEGDIHTLQADSKSLHDSMQDAQGNISSLQKTATSLDSEISSQDGRLSKVEQTATEHTSTISSLGDKLNNMQIGGRNYLRDSDKSISGWAQDLGTMPNEVLNYLAGETITVSVDTEWSNFQHSDSQQNRLGFELSVTGSDGKSYWFGAWKWPSTPSGKERVYSTFTLPANVTFTVTNNGQNGYVSINGTGRVSHAQVEIGNVSKDWQPAPEDLATVTQVKQTSDSITTTLKNMQGDVDQVTQKANGTSEQLADVKGDVTNIQKDVSGLKQTTADNAGNINTLQSDSKSLHDSMQDIQGNISTLQKTATDVTSELQDHAGRISKVEQTASTLTNEFSDQDGRLSKVEQTATGTQQTVANQQGQINSIQTDVSGIHETITGQGNQITTINATLNGLDTKYEGVSGNLSDLDRRTMQNRGTVDSPDFNSLTQAGYYTITSPANGKNYPASSWGTLEVSGQVTDANGRLNQKYVSDNNGLIYTRQYNNLNNSWTSWVKAANQNDIDTLSGKITTNSTQITQNKQAIALKADQSTVDNLTGEVSQNTAQLKVQADQISSKVSSSDFKTLNDKVNGAISSIQKNSTAIDQTNKQISLKADQTEVDQVKQTATQNSSRLDVMDGQISSKVTSTDVNNIVDSKGFATTNTVQSLITQTAGTINESIVKLGQTVKQGAENNVQLVRKSDFEDGDKGGWDAQTVVTTDPPAELGQSGMKVLQTNVRDDYEDGIWYSVKPGEKCDVDFWCKPSTACYSQLGLVFADKDYNNWSWGGIATDQSGQWKHYTGTITAPANASFAKPWFQMNKDGSNTTDTALLAKPSIRRQNATTVAAIQQITASIDGLQSNVADFKNNTSSQITQLSNLISTKVSSSDFDNLSKSVNLQTLDSADINNMRTNGHYFVHNLANNPIGGWVYVDVTGNGNDRIRQDVYQDSGIGHKYRRLFGTSWTGWEEGATESEITQLSDDINLRVAKGDVISQINEEAGGNTLIQVSNGKGSLILDADNTIVTGKAWVPDAAISNISADKIMLGSSSLYDSNGTLNLVNVKDGTTSKITVTQGSVNFDGINKTASIINFASDNNTNAFTVNPNGATVTPTLFFERFNQTVGHWLGFTRNDIQEEGVAFNTWDNDGERFAVACHARFEKNLRTLGVLSQGSWDGTPAKPEAGVLTIKNGNTIWSGSDFLAVGSNVTGTYTGVWAKAFVQQSTLSAKTNIETVDPKYALDLVNKTDIRSYQYKSDVAQGYTKRYTSLIIDDVNDVSKYYAPDEFTNEERTGRDDGSAVGYLFLAVKELTRRIKILEDKLHG